MKEDENFSITITYRAEDIEMRGMDFGQNISVAECVKILKQIKADHEFEYGSAPARTLGELESYDDQLPSGLLDRYIENRETSIGYQDELKHAIWTDKYNKNCLTKDQA